MFRCVRTENGNLLREHIWTGFAMIVKAVEVNGNILDELISNDVISFELQDKIEIVSTRENRTQKLLEHILTSSNPRAPFFFLEALKRDYKWLVDALVSTEISSEGKDDMSFSSLLAYNYCHFAS